MGKNFTLYEHLSKDTIVNITFTNYTLGFHIKYTAQPEKLEVEDFDNQCTENGSLENTSFPSNDMFKLRATVGFPDYVYNWEYSFDNKTFYSYLKGNGVDNIVISGW